MDQVWGCGMTILKYEEDKQMEGNLDTPHYHNENCLYLLDCIMK